MCIGVPGKIIKISGNDGTADVGGSTRDISMMLLDGASVGDWVLIHAGYAMSIVDEAQALEILDYLKAMAETIGEPA